jgi:hypothetical protein
MCVYEKEEKGKAKGKRGGESRRERKNMTSFFPLSLSLCLQSLSPLPMKTKKIEKKIPFFSSRFV